MVGFSLFVIRAWTTGLTKCSIKGDGRTCNSKSEMNLRYPNCTISFHDGVPTTWRRTQQWTFESVAGTTWPSQFIVDAANSWGSAEKRCISFRRAVWLESWLAIENVSDSYVNVVFLRVRSNPTMVTCGQEALYELMRPLKWFEFSGTFCAFVSVHARPNKMKTGSA